MIIKKERTGVYTIENLPLFISLWYWQDKTLKSASVRTRDFKGIQDAQVGDFAENWYCRPRKAVQRKPYTTLRAYKTACILSLKGIKPNVVLSHFSIDSDDDDYNTICEVI